MNGLSNRNIILILMVIQLAITLPFINYFPVDLDEPFSIFYAQQDLNEMFKIFVGENNPPLHFVLLHFWVKMFGISAFSVRSLSLLFSVLTIPVLFKFSLKLTSKRLAIFTVSLFIFSSLMHFHAIEARTYALFVFIVSFSFYELYKILFERQKAFLLFAILNALMLYTHYLSGYIIGVQFILIIIFYKRFFEENKWWAIKSYVLSTLLFAPGLYLFYLRLKHFSTQGTWVPEPNFLDLLTNLFKFYNKEFAFLILILSIIITIIYNKKKQKRFSKISSSDWFIFLLFGLNYFGLFIFSLVFQPVYLDRYLLFIIPFFYLVIAVILKKIKFDELPLYIFIIPLIAFLVVFKIIPDNNREGDKMAKFIHKEKKEKFRVFICPPWYNLTFYYHFDQAKFKEYKNLEISKPNQEVVPVYSKSELVYSDSIDQYFYVDAGANFVLPENSILPHLKDTLTLVNTVTFKGDYTIYQFNKP